VIQPWNEIAALAKHYNAILHCDAVQAAGKIKLDFRQLNVAMLTLSAHKIGGSQGCGALIVADNQPLHSLLRGGGQEQRRRAGTENLVGIVGFGAAAALIAEDIARQPALAAMRDGLEANLRQAAPNLLIAGVAAPRVANTTCLIMSGLPSATQLMVLDLAGFAVSSGAACSSGKVTASHVLAAMGYDSAASSSAIRVSFGWQNTPDDALMLAQMIKKMYSRV
jgi:cysteine desulfurase